MHMPRRRGRLRVAWCGLAQPAYARTNERSARDAGLFSFGEAIMTKYEIMALMMRKKGQVAENPFTIAARLATCLESLSERLSDGEREELIQIGGAIYQLGVDECKQVVPLEDLFPACENWPFPNPDRGGFRHER